MSSKFWLVLFLTVFSSGLAGAAGLPPRFELSLSNDLLAGNADDRYTAALAVRVPLPRSHLRLDYSERMFTDRAAGRRFDESRLTLVREGLARGGWVIDTSVGLLAVGRGLLGEGAQNAVHGLVGSDDVELAYLDDDGGWFAELGLRAVGPALGSGPRGWIRPEFELAVAPGFAVDASLRLAASFHPAPPVELRFAVGVHSANSQLDVLDRHLESMAPELSIGVILFERLAFTWTDNHFGTGDDHIHLQWRFGVDTRDRGRSAR